MNYDVLQLLKKSVELFGPEPAVISSHTTWSYNDIEAGSNALADQLLHARVARGSIVAILSTHSIDIILGIIAVLKVGAAFMPIDPHLPLKRLEIMFTEVTPTCILADRTLEQGLIDTLLSTFPVPCFSINPSDSQFLQEGQKTICLPHASPEPDDMCYVFFTSGSTGKPKGIAGRYKGIGHFVQWEIKMMHVSAGTRVSQLAHPSFDACLRDIWVPLCSGGAICVIDDRTIIQNPKRLIHWLDSQQINLVHCVPSVFRSLLNEKLDHDLFPSLKYVVLAGEPLLPSDVKRWRASFGDRIQLVNLYGPSETTMTKFYYFVQPEDGYRRTIPIGKPMEGASALIVNELGQPALTGTIGEIYIRTPYRTKGYINQPELNQQVFIQNPFRPDPDDIVYKTGDFGLVREDGNFEFLGRRDHQVKIRGIRIELDEIEDMFRQHEDVRDVAVIEREDTNGMMYLCAYVVLKKEIGFHTLREFLSLSLPEVMVPSSFILMKELPRTISGKIDRNSLIAPDQARPEFIVPRNVVELKLAQFWADILGIWPIGVKDNFFQLGGHSLSALRLIARVEQAFGTHLPLASILEQPTVEEVGRYIRQKNQTSNFSSLIPIQPAGNRPAFFCVHPLGGTVLCYYHLALHMGQEWPFYAFQAQGLDISSGPVDKIEEMANHYVQELCRFQPKGPYFLGGWSMGGVVAYEMARQIQLKGQQVAILALFDSSAPGDNIEPDSRSDVELMIDVFGDEINISQDVLLQIHPDDRLAYILGQAKEANKIPQDFELTQAKVLLNVFRADIRAREQYLPQPYEGRAICFWAGDDSGETIREEELKKWCKLINGRVDSFIVSGNHLNIISEPDVKVLAQQLKTYLENIDISLC